MLNLPLLQSIKSLGRKYFICPPIFLPNGSKPDPSLPFFVSYGMMLSAKHNFFFSVVRASYQSELFVLRCLYQKRTLSFSFSAGPGYIKRLRIQIFCNHSLRSRVFLSCFYRSRAKGGHKSTGKKKFDAVKKSTRTEVTVIENDYCSFSIGLCIPSSLYLNLVMPKSVPLSY